MDEATQRQLSHLMGDASNLLQRFEDAQPTLRQRYAAAALTGYMSNASTFDYATKPDTVARDVLAIADAMLAAEREGSRG